MRKGYWKILLRRLRGRIASGADTFAFRQTEYVIANVLASDDDCLDSPDVSPLAATADGAVFFIDLAGNLVTVRAAQGDEAQATDLDLPGFIDALASRSTGTMALGIVLDEADLPEMLLPANPRKPRLGD